MNIIKNQVIFFNWTDKDFFHPYDGEMYTFKAGESVTLPNDVARHFAKHLANRESYRDNRDKENPIEWKQFFDKCFPASKPAPAIDIKLEDAEVSRVKPVGSNPTAPTSNALSDDEYKV